MTERQEEQAALHALHMLEAHEQQILRSEMRHDARLRLLAGELESAAAHLTLVVPPQPPPADLRRGILLAVKRRRRAKRTPLRGPLAILAGPWVAWPAALIAVLIAWRAGEAARREGDRAAALARSEAAARADAGQARAALAEGDRKLREAASRAEQLASEVARLGKAGNMGRIEVAVLRAAMRRFEEASAVAVWDPQAHQVKLRIERIPQPPAGKDYQLWLIDRKSGQPLSAGAVKVDPRGATVALFEVPEAANGVSRFVLSLEARGGAPRKPADGAIVLAGAP